MCYFVQYVDEYVSLENMVNMQREGIYGIFDHSLNGRSLEELRETDPNEEVIDYINWLNEYSSLELDDRLYGLSCEIDEATDENYLRSLQEDYDKYEQLLNIKNYILVEESQVSTNGFFKNDDGTYLVIGTYNELLNQMNQEIQYQLDSLEEEEEDI